MPTQHNKQGKWALRSKEIKMKKQTNPNIQAHLLRSAFHLILLVVVCVIPFALAQQTTSKQNSVAAPLLLGSAPVATSANSDDPTPGIWTVTGSLNTARRYHTQTLLPNGKILVAGGYNDIDGVLSSAELYDPASGTWTFTGSLNTARMLHTATLLQNGKVLVAGGVNTDNVSSAELYDPVSGIWTVTGSLNTARFYHTATLLPNGKVVVLAGTQLAGFVTSAEQYDPASGNWSF